MKVIATQVDDSAERLAAAVAAQQARPGYAMDSYFYRSHLVFEKISTNYIILQNTHLFI